MSAINLIRRRFFGSFYAIVCAWASYEYPARIVAGWSVHLEDPRLLKTIRKGLMWVESLPLEVRGLVRSEFNRVVIAYAPARSGGFDVLSKAYLVPTTHRLFEADDFFEFGLSMVINAALRRGERRGRTLEDSLFFAYLWQRRCLRGRTVSHEQAAASLGSMRALAKESAR